MPKKIQLGTYVYIHKNAKNNEVPTIQWRQFKKKDPYLLHTSNSTHETESLQPQAILPLFYVPPLLIKNPPKKQMIMEKKE